MSTIDILVKMPCWYISITVVFSLYYAIRGIMEQIIYSKAPNCPFKTRFQKIFILYIQEFLFKTIITVSSFLALFIANYIISIKPINDIGAGTAVLLIFLIFWGLTGASGYLTFIILFGKFPSIK